MATREQRLYIQWCQSQPLTVEVGGSEAHPDKEEFQIPRDFLRWRSMPFRRMIDGHFKEAKNSRIKLPETPVSIFQTFYIWSMSPKPNISSDLSFEVLLELVIFATKYIILALHNQAMDALVQKMKSTVWLPSTDVVAHIYGDVDGNSKLRKLVRMNLGDLKRLGAGNSWKELFLEYPELGWDFFELETKGRPPQHNTPKTCEFHDHGKRTPKDHSRLPGSKGCPHEAKETFPQNFEDLAGIESEACTGPDDRTG